MSAAARFAAALALLRCGEARKARDVLERLVADGGEASAAVWNALGALRYDAGELSAARAALERCVALEPSHPLAHATLGELALRRRDVPAATRHFGVTLRATRPGLENVQRWVKALWADATRPGCGR